MKVLKNRQLLIALIAVPAAVGTWSGWVGLGKMCGFGEVHPLPGIADQWTINTTITLPIGVEAYGALAMSVWLGSVAEGRARTFAKWSALGALFLGLLGQVAYHLLEINGKTRAPDPVVVGVACLPVIVLGLAAALGHMIGHQSKARTEAADETRTDVTRTAPAAPLAPTTLVRTEPVQPVRTEPVRTEIEARTDTPYGARTEPRTEPVRKDNQTRTEPVRTPRTDAPYATRTEARTEARTDSPARTDGLHSAAQTEDPTPEQDAESIDRAALVVELASEIVLQGDDWKPNYPALMERTGFKRSWCERVVRDARKAATEDSVQAD